MAYEFEWWKNTLAEDIYATLRLREQTIPFFHAQSSQLWLRSHLLDWMSVVVNNLAICATADHLAVYLLDTFMDGLEVDLPYISLVALVCLSIAVKFENRCDKIPLFSILNSYIPMNQYNAGQPYTVRQFAKMEMDILRYMSFELCVPTVAHFMPYYLQVALNDYDLLDGMPIISKVHVQMYYEKLAFYFQDIVLQDNWSRNYPPSLVAAACVACAKISKNLTPVWPEQLKLMTNYTLEQLLPCLHNLTGTYTRICQTRIYSLAGLPSYQSSSFPCASVNDSNFPSIIHTYVPTCNSVLDLSKHSTDYNQYTSSSIVP